MIFILFVCFGLSSASTYQPSDVCFLTDHETIPKGHCTFLANIFADSGLRPGKSLPKDYIDYLTRALKRSGSSSYKDGKKMLRAYHSIIPCLNRNYACEAGYSFIMPSSPKLTLLQSSTKIPDVVSALHEMNYICEAKNVTLKKNWKGDIFKERRRSQTWCKVLLIERLLVKFPGCKLAVFLDADLLMIPPKVMRSKQTENLIWEFGLSGINQKDLMSFKFNGIKNIHDVYKTNLNNPNFFNQLKTDSFFEFGLVGRAKSLYACQSNDININNNHLGCENTLLNLNVLQSFLNNKTLLFYTSTTNGGPTFGHEQWMNPLLAPKTLQESILNPMGTWNNCENTKSSTSFMLVKNTYKSINILKDWWSSVDPKHHPDLLDALGQPLRIYRSSWAHEQRVFDDYVSVRYNKHVAISERAFDFNTPLGLFAQHYFEKQKHMDQYASIAVSSWANDRSRAKCSVKHDEDVSSSLVIDSNTSTEIIRSHFPVTLKTPIPKLPLSSSSRDTPPEEIKKLRKSKRDAVWVEGDYKYKRENGVLYRRKYKKVE